MMRVLIPNQPHQLGLLGSPAEGGCAERSTLNGWEVSLCSLSAGWCNNFQMKLILEERRVRELPGPPVLLLSFLSFLRLCHLPDPGVHEFPQVASKNSPFAWVTERRVSVTCNWENFKWHSVPWPGTCLSLQLLFLTPLPQPQVACCHCVSHCRKPPCLPKHLGQGPGLIYLCTPAPVTMPGT